MVIKKKASKRLKSSWRKHSGINDVEDFLEDKRLEERLGKPLDTIANDDLFKIDTKPTKVPERISKKEKRILLATKPLNCFSLLRSHTNASDPIVKRNHVKSKEERKNDLIKKKELRNRAKGILKAKEIEAQANRKLDELRRSQKPKRGEFTVDLWNNDADDNFPNQFNEWLTTNTKKHNLCGVGISTNGVSKFANKKPSLFPAIEAPHPGMSYNPSFKDHQDLLRIVGEKEMKIIKTENHLTRCTTGMFIKVTSESRDKNWLIEMSEGLPSKDGTNVEENTSNGGEYSTVNPPVENKKKSLKKRRKQKEQKELDRQRKALKIEKQKVTDIHKLKLLEKQLDKIQKKHIMLQEKRKRKAELKKKQPKTLNSIKYEEPDLEFNLGKDIAGNLKNLKTEGNLLVDRFKSMQKRNILAPSKLHIYKKPKVKKYTKPGHKDEIWKKTVAIAL